MESGVGKLTVDTSGLPVDPGAGAQVTGGGSRGPSPRPRQPAEVGLPADERVEGQEPQEHRAAVVRGDHHPHHDAQDLAFDEAPHQQVAEEAVDQAGGAHGEAVGGGDQPDAEPVGGDDQQADRQEAADAAEGGDEAEDQQRKAVARDVAEAEVEEGRQGYAGEAVGLARPDAVRVEGVAGGVVDRLDQPQQGHPAQHQLGGRERAVLLRPVRNDRARRVRTHVPCPRGVSCALPVRSGERPAHLNECPPGVAG